MSDVLTNQEEETRDLGSRYRLLYGAVGIAVLFIFLRLWYLQIIKGNELHDFSLRNRIKDTRLPSPRGNMYAQGPSPKH